MTITLPEELERRTLALVDSGRFASADELVAEVMRDFFERCKPPRPRVAEEPTLDIYKRLNIDNLVESGPDSPNDLSTNPIHMEGFGEQDLASSRTRPESCLDIARRIGLVGSAEGLPDDISTNRDHFEGFGGA